MLRNTKCECGHQNHIGTVLCEACGKPVDDTGGTGPLEMRYDGVARRSMRTERSVLSKVWSFFSSVKIAVIMIVILLVAAAVGTILPQENVLLSHVKPAEYYSGRYGVFGTIMYTLGLTNVFDSWWFKLLLLMIGVSLVVCSLDRVLPLYRALAKQQVRKHLTFIRRQKIIYTCTMKSADGYDPEHPERWVDTFAAAAKKRGYRIYSDGTALLAEKHRFSRWGPYINHIGLIILLIAVMLGSSIPGWHMDEYINLYEGEIKQVPGTSYYIENVDFTHEVYGGDEVTDDFRKRDVIVDKLFMTKAVLYECTADCGNPLKPPVLKRIVSHDIIVNKPLRHNGINFYQFHYEDEPKIITVQASLMSKETGDSAGSFALNMINPAQAYEAGPYKLTLVNYYPDFEWKDGQPSTKSRDPNAPAFIFRITGPNLPEQGEVNMYFPLPRDKQRFHQDEINGKVGASFDISVMGMDDVQFSEYTSFLNVRKETALPYIFAGAIVFLIGVVMGLYWQHRRIWLRIDEDELNLGAHTNKNWYGIRHEVSHILGKSGITIDPKSLQRGGSEA